MHKYITVLYLAGPGMVMRLVDGLTETESVKNDDEMSGSSAACF